MSTLFDSVRKQLSAYLCLIFLFTLLTLAGVLIDEPYFRAFTILFIFRYLRLAVGIIGYVLHKPYPVKKLPTYTGQDVTVLIPTVEPFGEDFTNTIHSVRQSGCAKIVVIVPTSILAQENVQLELEKLKGFVSIVDCPVTNKRHQVRAGLGHVSTDIVVLCDDHVFWPRGFLEGILAPFEDRKVGGIAVWKRVIRNYQALFSVVDFLNSLGALYLERHNFDLTASHAVDGGLFVISGRTAAYRTCILQDDEFLKKFCHETWFFGKVGPLHAGDDNCLTRWLVDKGWKLAWQHGSPTVMETVLGDSGFNKFNKQCIRWVRTTWLSNSASLFADRTVWLGQPWSVYSIYISSFFNFALFIDTSLVYLGVHANLKMWIVLCWISASKLVKLAPHFVRHPRDIWYLPGYVLFGYYHSLLKLYSLLTIWDISWGSRPEHVK